MADFGQSPFPSSPLLTPSYPLLFELLRTSNSVLLPKVAKTPQTYKPGLEEGSGQKNEEGSVDSAPKPVRLWPS